ncbi:TRAP transporter permease [Saccharospirillum salsuginis]|uniref:Transporter n=1 Tax=Saccharospirillum salsuginis TaxID=418750 RepID=A0A918NCY5_9GAMM|nr:TRAP transporter permease [Saccharospirillum salsuginis]GGX58436.1 transporter [Saccharospirillum salsuginis]
MTQDDSNSKHDRSAEDIVAQSETGARHLPPTLDKIFWLLLLLWSIFQVWYASPFPFMLNFMVLNEDQAKVIHLAFALLFAYTFYPASPRADHSRILWYDWAWIIVGVCSVGYLIVFRDQLVERSGAATPMDVAIGVLGLISLLEATRRALGKPLLIVASVFLLYTYLGPYMPDVISHAGGSVRKIVSHQWLTTEGVFGVALGVSVSFVFLFVMFGALLERAGAGNYFIKLAFSLLGHMRGGPAKAAVVSSGLSGVISGSSIANVVTTGTFTIPLMKRVGFPGTKAGAIEVAASTNGQLTPPIMGAAAFLMVEYVGISYLEVIKHAILPAMISYIALIYIVHLEAVKANMKGIERSHVPTILERLVTWLTTAIVLMVLSLGIYYGTGWFDSVLGNTGGSWAFMAVMVVLYLALVKLAAGVPDLEIDDPDDPDVTIPEAGPTLKAGLYFLVPVLVLVWALTVKRYSPQQSAFYATVFLMFIVVTHRALIQIFRGEAERWWREIQSGSRHLVDGMVAGARNMIGIGIATAAAGIVVGTVTLTGLGQMMTELVEILSGGSILVMLMLTAVICVVLGMGLPTTANYIVVSTIMAPVIVNVGAENGLIVPLIAVHLFVFYFGILADDTPPVGLAAFAAAAIARSDPIKTGVQGFTYDIRTAVLPFMFIFNTQLLLIGIESVLDLVITIVSAIMAMLVFAAATQGYWLTRTRWWETAALLLIAFTLFRPGYWWDRLYPPVEHMPATQLEETVMELEPGDPLRLAVSGISIEGSDISRTVVLDINNRLDTFEARLSSTGLGIREEGGQYFVDTVTFGSPADKAGLFFDWEIEAVVAQTDRPPKEWMFIPALALLGGLAYMQIRRRQRMEGDGAHVH